MANFNLSLLFVFFASFVGSSLSWSQDELDIFDLVEEIGENFYELLKVEKDCTAADIRKAYRRLSLQYHPDKNPDPNAAEIFTKIGAVADILRDEEKRAMYDDVLENGLPDWKQPIYYYRRVRKMSVLELLALLLVILTVGQFLYGWAAYFEKQIVLYELKAKRDEKVKKSKGKKVHQQLEAEVMYHELMAESYLPRLKKLLPVLILKSFYYIGKALLYGTLAFLLSYRKKKADSKTEEEKLKEQMLREEAEREEEEEKEKRLREQEEKARIKSEKKLRKLEQNLKATRLKNEQKELENKQTNSCRPEVKTDMEERLREIEQEYDEEESIALKTSRGGKKRIKKGRRIVDLSETVVPAEAEAAANTFDENSETSNDVESLVNISDSIEPNGWSQYQQKQLEWALSHYTKHVEERWDKIAKAVPGKSKADCLARYKELVRLVHSKQKEVK